MEFNKNNVVADIKKSAFFIVVLLKNSLTIFTPAQNRELKDHLSITYPLSLVEG
ncbi:hypothetical protein XBJ1_2729 [Xenorhabdus bovienii SS-2004]|uniref:Uncharacterized protein n=1 Tax=Xenorhabdus bovienii (strain SS-2004) TaxID=406818 RepID=D3V7P1_XENBS|nr:hypothetical protein XBJ1_2729 [Xenorhabdus bovienii SS-2004]